MLFAIEEAFNKQIEEDEEEFSYQTLFEYLDWKSHDLILTELGWELSMSDNYGGEGQGESYWYVIKVSDGKTVRHIKVDGGYASYCGGEYDEWFEVFPREKVITEWVQ